MRTLTHYLSRHAGKICIAGGIVIASFIAWCIPDSIAFLNFFFLLVVLGGYCAGRRLSVPGVLLCIGILILYAVLFPVRVQAQRGLVLAAYFIPTWGGVLVLAGAAIGYQQEKLRREKENFKKLTTELLESNERLKRARAETVIGLATLTECRDRDTGLHLERVSEFCRIIAEELRRSPPLDSYITDEYVADLVLSSVLHDIGKVGVPDSILLKSGALTGDEFETMKIHTTVGGDALTAIEARLEGRSFFTLGKQIAYHHHERWDGRGYPGGLKGDSIPLSARIVSVADTYDAITADRVYRAALSHEEAVRRISVERGTQFDPRVVDALLARQEDLRCVCSEKKLQHSGAAAT